MRNFCLFALFLSVLMLCASCQKIDFSEYDDAESTLKVVTRASEGANITYPVTVYAFTTDGKCQAQQTIASASESLSLPLALGTYRVVALSGTSCCSLPTSPRLTSLITFASTITEPLLMGQATVNLSQSSSSVYIQLGQAMTSLQFFLKDVPTDVTGVTVTVSDVCSQCTLAGEGTTPVTMSVPLSQSGTIWQCDKTYALPTSAQTVFTVNLTRATGNVSYAYTYSSALRSGTPYTFNGTFQNDQLYLSGEFTVADWGEPVVVNFNFGPGATQQEISGDIPAAGTIWQDHLVALVNQTSDTQADLVLLSLQEWDELPSALNSTNPDAAANIAAQYVEGDQSGWSIPTTDQAKALRAAYTGSALTSLNYVISDAGGTPISDTDADGNIRYLCDDANSSFAFVSNSTISKAGTSSKNYHLRLVKTITFTK